MKKLRILLLIMISTLLVGCSRSDIEVFRFVNHEIQITVGETTTLELIYGEFNKDQTVIYSLSEEGIINLEENVVTGLSAGEVTISATIDNQKYARTIIKVTNENIISMKVTVPKDVIYIGESLNLSDFVVTVTPSHLSNAVEWSVEDSYSSDPTVINFNQQTNTITGLRGADTIDEYKAGAGGTVVYLVGKSLVDPSMSVKKQITVKYYSTTSVTLEAADGVTSIELGETLQLNASLTPSNASQTIIFSSSNSSIASVDANGLVSTVNSTRIGPVTITAQSLDGRKATIVITVNPPTFD